MNVILALTGAAVMLVGCQIDPPDKAPGGLKPCASSQQSDDRDDAGRGDSGGSETGGDSSSGGSGGSNYRALTGGGGPRDHGAALASAGATSIAQM